MKLPNPICRFCGANMAGVNGRRWDTPMWWCQADRRHFFHREPRGFSAAGVWIDEHDQLHLVSELPAWAVPAARTRQAVPA